MIKIRMVSFGPILDTRIEPEYEASSGDPLRVQFLRILIMVALAEKKAAFMCIATMIFHSSYTSISI